MPPQNEKPVIFNSEMVKAILDGRKTQTRRVIKPQPTREGVWWVIRNKKPMNLPGGNVASEVKTNEEIYVRGVLGLLKCPYSVVGDRLWVREARCENEWGIFWKSDGSLNSQEAGVGAKWTSPIHMRKIEARIWLEITGIRVERVQEITKDRYSSDIWQEGICQICDDEGIRYDSDPLGEPPQYCGGNGGMGCFADYKDLFRELWDSINAKRGYGWEVNPWVWVVEFRKVEDEQ